MVELVDSGVRLPGFRFQLCLFLAGWPVSTKQRCVVVSTGISHVKYLNIVTTFIIIITVITSTTLGIPFYCWLKNSQRLEDALSSTVVSFFLIRLRKYFDYVNYQKFESFFPYTKPLAVMCVCIIIFIEGT